MSKNVKAGVAAIAFLSLLVWSFAFAAEDINKKAGDKGQSLSKTAGTPIFQLLNINNYTSWVRSDNSGNLSPHGDNQGIYPRGTGANVIYTDGIVWGAKAFTNAAKTTPAPRQPIRVGGKSYGFGQKAGRVIGSGAAAVPADPNAADTRIFRVRRDYASMSDDELRRDAAESNEISITEVTDAQMATIRTQYDKDWKEWPVAYGAPYIDRNKNGRYDPPPAFSTDPLNPTFTVDSLIAQNRDEPGVAGADPNSPADQVIWTVANDLDVSQALGLYGSEPVGFEAQYTIWGYKRTDALGNLYFKRIRLINKGGVEVDATTKAKGSFWLDSLFVCQWSDIDLGNAGDDLAGCDSTLSMGFIYNGFAEDNTFRKYGLPPAASGYDFLAGPTVSAPGDSAVVDFKRKYGVKNLPMSSFAYFSAGSPYSDPPNGQPNSYNTNAGLWWKLLRGFAPLGSFTTSDQPFASGPFALSKFPLSGDPTTGKGFLDGLGFQGSFAPGDRRILLNTGPFTMAPGDTQEIVVGTVAGLGADRLSSVAVMKFNDRFVQNTFDALFQVPRPPLPPDVKIAELDGQVVLEWGSNTTRISDVEQKVSNPGSYRFEGYNVYQLPQRNSRLSVAKRVVTYDTQDDPTVVLDEQFDTPSGQILRIPVFFGSNSGIKRNFNFARDYIKDIDKIYNGQEYYLVVTAYSVSTIPGYLPAALESAPVVLTVRPKVPFGMKLNAKYSDTVAVVHSPGKSDGMVAPIVVDPTKLTGDSYRVSFKVDPNDPANFLWTLANTTKNKNLLVDQTNQGDNDLHTVLDGMLLKVIGPPVAVNTWEFEGGTRWFTGVDWGGGQFFGGLDLGANFFGSNITPDKYVTVEVRFRTNKDGQRAYRYLRGGSPNYSYQDYEQQHFTVWDVTSNPPRQLNAAYVEQNGNAAANKEWGPTTSSSAREYLFILNSTYSATPDPYYTSRSILAQAGEFDALYALWPLLRGSRTAPQWADGQIFRIIPNFANTDKDVFTFSTASYAPTTGDQLVKASANSVGVYPNPYYAFNPAETNRFNRFVTFNNLPQKATVRIFNLAGQLVRTIDKDDLTQFLRWDLLNQSNLPVASGVYIAHIDMPDVGVTKVLKLAIIQEQEILDTY